MVAVLLEVQHTDTTPGVCKGPPGVVQLAWYNASTPSAHPRRVATSPEQVPPLAGVEEVRERLYNILYSNAKVHSMSGAGSTFFCLGRDFY